MEKKLYRVRVVLYVMAENNADACMAATRARFDIFECTARTAENVAPEWRDAIPYNADDERSCSEIMANKQKTTRPQARAVELPSYVKAGIRAFDADALSDQTRQQYVNADSTIRKGEMFERV